MSWVFLKPSEKENSSPQSSAASTAQPSASMAQSSSNVAVTAATATRPRALKMKTTSPVRVVACYPFTFNSAAGSPLATGVNIFDALIGSDIWSTYGLCFDEYKVAKFRVQVNLSAIAASGADNLCYAVAAYDVNSLASTRSYADCLSYGSHVVKEIGPYISSNEIRLTAKVGTPEATAQGIVGNAWQDTSVATNIDLGRFYLSSAANAGVVKTVQGIMWLDVYFRSKV